jgi:hypothetical protein
MFYNSTLLKREELIESGVTRLDRNVLTVEGWFVSKYAQPKVSEVGAMGRLTVPREPANK